MRILIFAFVFGLLFCSCKEKLKHQYESPEIEYGENAMSDHDSKSNIINTSVQTKHQIDVDTISITSNELFYSKSEGNNHFTLQIDLPNFDNYEINQKILQWINNNLEEVIDDSTGVNVDRTHIDHFDEYKSSFNKKYNGDLQDIRRMAQFYSNKHFDIYQGIQLGIDYNINCKKIYESKDIVSYEIVEFFCNYSIMQSFSLCRGATFFKYNGNQLVWAMFEDSDVKEVLKQEVNSQFLKFPDDKYEEFLLNSKYKAFTMPSNPPYMVKDGLKFIYKNKELSEKEGNDQIFCVVPLEKLNLMQSLSELLQ